AIEQAHAEFSLQCTDPTTELRSLHAQHLGSRGIAAAVDNLGKEVEVVQVLEGVHGEWPSKEAGTLIWHSQKASPDWGLNKGLLQHYPLRVRGLGSPQARSGEERTMLRVRAVDTPGALLRIESGISRTPYYCKGVVARSRRCNGGFESPSSHPGVLQGQRAQAAQTNAIKRGGVGRTYSQRA